MFRVVSLFSGCGGLDLGFRDRDFDLVYSCDNDAAAVECYARNIDKRVYQRDVTSDLFHDEIAALGRADIVLGGFPCQGFSKAGPKNSDDPRNNLYVEMKRAVERLQPALFIAENVDGLSQNFGGSYVQKIVADFGAIGYHVEYRILEAACYGLPQYRRRVFFVGLRSDTARNFPWPTPTHAVTSRNGEFKIDHELDDGALWVTDPSSTATPGTLLPRRTIRDAIGDLLELSDAVPDHRVLNNWPDEYKHVFSAIKEGQKLCNVRHSATSVYTWEIPQVFGKVTRTERIVLETISKHRRHKKHGSIPNGNPLSPEVIAGLSGLKSVEQEIQSLLAKGYLKDKGGRYDLLGAMFCSGLFKRPSWNEPSPTVLTVFDSPRYFLHPLKDRPFSVRECARLQGFPDDFAFTTTDKRSDMKAAYRLIGNAVPPPLAARFADAAKSVLVARNAARQGSLFDETSEASTASRPSRKTGRVRHLDYALARRNS
jgi:DNA (cytosine-5)-methyltransferase 1